MRAFLIVVALLAAVGAAWLLLRPDEGATALGGAGMSRAATDDPRGTESELRAEAPRVGVLGPRDRDLVADPDAPAWHTQILRFSVVPGSRLTGLVLLEAVGEHLYVRARDLDTLDALKRQDLGIEVPPDMPFSTVVPLLERAGYVVQVQEPRFVFRRMTPEEHEARNPR